MALHQRRSAGRVQLLVVTALAALLHGAAGQGYQSKGKLGSTNKGSSALRDSYLQAVTRAQALSRAYKLMSAADKEACLTTKGDQSAARCSNIGAAMLQDTDVVSLATAPQAFSWVAGYEGSSPLASPFGPVGDQKDCWTCVSFCVAATASAAVARVLGVPGSQVSMSVQDVGFCPYDADDIRFCQTPWDIPSAMSRLVTSKVVKDGCLPYTASGGDDTPCAYKCQDVDPLVSQGTFKPRQIRSLAAAQNQLRRFGGVMTRINIYTDFRPFFLANPAGVYDGKMCNDANAANLDEEHAVVLVGYNNREQYWIVRNSWGPDFANKGYFKIKFGVCGVASPGEMYGVTWTPGNPRKVPLKVSLDVESPGCYIYRARAGDNLGVLADTWSVPVVDLLRNNSASIADLNEPLGGKLLTVCGISTQFVDIQTPNSGRGGGAAAQQQTRGTTPTAEPAAQLSAPRNAPARPAAAAAAPAAPAAAGQATGQPGGIGNALLNGIGSLFGGGGGNRGAAANPNPNRGTTALPIGVNGGALPLNVNRAGGTGGSIPGIGGFGFGRR